MGIQILKEQKWFHRSFCPNDIYSKFLMIDSLFDQYGDQLFEVFNIEYDLYDDIEFIYKTIQYKLSTDYRKICYPMIDFLGYSSVIERA